MTSSYFDNIQDVLTKRVALSQHNIYIAVAWFTNDIIFESLKSALNKKVKVKVVILNDLINRNEFGLDFGVLTKLGADVRFARSDSGTMHNKFCIIDNMVITGSYNWTYHANKNDENILITDEESVVDRYREEFDRLFGAATPIPLPYEHLKWTDVKEGDFSELRRNIFRDVISKNDENTELKKNKLIKLNQALKSSNAEELARASLLPTKRHFRTITDVLTTQSQHYITALWEENTIGKPLDNVEGHIRLEKWFFVPSEEVMDDMSHQTYIKGNLKVYSSRYNVWSRGIKIKVYDEEFIEAVKTFWNPLKYNSFKLIPEQILTIEFAKLYYFQFPTPMFNKSQPRTWKNSMPRTISAINLLGIAKGSDGDDVLFYDGWDPKIRGEKIMKEFFVKGL